MNHHLCSHHTRWCINHGGQIFHEDDATVCWASAYTDLDGHVRTRTELLATRKDVHA